jgi:hypothetical protein
MGNDVQIVNSPEIYVNSIFDTIDNIKSQHGIINYILRVTTFEEVFLKLNFRKFSNILFQSNTR